MGVCWLWNSLFVRFVGRVESWEKAKVREGEKRRRKKKEEDIKVQRENEAYKKQ